MMTTILKVVEHAIKKLITIFIFIKSTVTNMSSSMNDDAVSHRGMLRNMLRQGFTILQCLFEKGDNSLAAFATKMGLGICTKTNTLCFSDNAGIKKDLAAAFRFHERSLPSLQHGRFGIGAKFAMVCLTLLKSIVHVFTRPNEGDPIKQLTIDYPRAIEMDRLRQELNRWN